ncbi:MAG: GNAT family N-acetyltransferase [Oscillochloridaceae bacterium umkhey_bin13]
MPIDDPPATIITSARLDLVPLTAECLAACLDDQREQAAGLLGASFATEWWEQPEVMSLRLATLRNDPAQLPWLIRAIVRRTDRLMIGHIGGHDRPGAAYLEPYAPGGLEFGYTVFAPYRRQGYAIEALGALMDWAAALGVPSFVLSISPTNLASLGVARHYGFEPVGSHHDPVDGLELIFRRMAL